MVDNWHGSKQTNHSEVNQKAERQGEKRKIRENKGLVLFWVGIHEISLFNEVNRGN